MSILLFFAAAISPDATTQFLPARPCGAAARSISQIAYAPYRSAVFGSDGLACATVKPGPADVASASSRSRETRPPPVLRGLGQKP